MTKKLIMSAEDIRRTIARIAHEIIERNHGCEDLVFIGIYTRGVPLAERIAAKIKEFEQVEIPVGALDFGLYRDDLSYLGLQPGDLRPSVIPFNLDGKLVVLIDDVLNTGRSVRAAMDALIEFGRPQRIQLAVFIDRGHREMPIRADYVGKNLPTSQEEAVEVQLKEIDGDDRVIIVKRERERELIGKGKDLS